MIATGCGFQPLYSHGSGNSSQVLNQLARIQISPVESRIGQILRNFLQDKLTPSGVPSSPTYRLAISLEETRSDMAILRDSTSTFAKVKMKAQYQLINIETKGVLNSGTVISTTVFNIVSSEYANINAQKDARRRTVRIISETVKERLALFFLKNHK
tara:strand:- start:1265 stop:1735 length:471 start_codon:yes stop_codon:yes gene_type:complete